MKLFTVYLVLAVFVASLFAFELDVLMPNVAPHYEDAYLCHSVKMDTEKSVYITEFLPRSVKEIAHHMLLFGCDEPGSSEDVWSCGEMVSSGTQQYKSGPVCRGRQSIIYAWAMDAPKLTLPENVAFKLGKDTQNKYLVLQVHYANVDMFRNGHTDQSGVSMVAQYEPLPKLAAVYLLNTHGYIKKETKDYFEVACQIREDVVMHPFAYRTHAHKLGLVNSGYRVRTDNGRQEWIEIGRRSPQLPQMFYPATNQVPIEKGDVIAARCTMENYLDHDVHIGSTGNDEMCNFYMMYYVEGDQLPQNNLCTSNGPPYWYFDKFKGYDGTKLDIAKIPKDASEAPVTNEKPVNHNAHKVENNMNEQHTNHELNSNHHMDSDEDIEELDRLEQELLAKKLLKKFLGKHH